MKASPPGWLAPGRRWRNKRKEPSGTLLTIARDERFDAKEARLKLLKMQKIRRLPLKTRKGLVKLRHVLNITAFGEGTLPVSRSG
jgi:hypothetical protein